MGYHNVKALKGGLKGWKEKGYPLAESPQAE
jgi:3-mercaptopyruvate sulfurtransferase SseA